MHLLRTLLFFEAILEFHKQASHISRMHNRLADALLHDKLSCFPKGLYNGAVALTSPILFKLPQLLQDMQTDWISADGNIGLIRSLRSYRHPPAGPIKLLPKCFSDFCFEFYILTPYPLTQRILCQCVSYLSSQ